MSQSNPFLRRKNEQVPSPTPQPPPFQPVQSAPVPFAPLPGATQAPPPMTRLPVAPPPAAHQGPPPQTQVTHSPISQTLRHGKTAADLYAHYQTPQQSAETEPEPDYTPAPIYHEPPATVLPPDQRIDSSSIPHPPAHFDGPVTFATDGNNETLPLPQTPMQVIEGTNSSPFFFRPTTSVIPEERSMLKTILSGKDSSFSTGLGVVLTPFAKNQEIHRVDRRRGIPRCSECRGYVNSFTTFSNYGRSFTCNLCGTVNDVPEYYQSTLDVNGRPLDISSKPELQFGSYEAVVDAEQFSMRKLSPPVFAFVLDVSVKAVSSGLLQAAVQGIKAATQLLLDSDHENRVGIAMVDVRTHYFYPMNGHIHEVVMADYEEAFPSVAPNRWLVPVTQETLPEIHAMLDHVLSYANSNSNATHPVLMSAIKGTVKALASCGGRVVVVQGSPSIGEGSSQVHEGLKVYGTTEESSMYNSPGDDAFLTALRYQLINTSTSIDLVCAGSDSDYFALASLESVISDTGGSIYFSSSLNSAYRDQGLAEVHAYLQILLLNPSARSISGRLRLSEGLHVDAYYGGLTSDSQGNTFLCSCMTPSSSIVAEIEMDRYIKGPYAFAQFAVLYYNDQNEASLRVFNYRFSVTTDYSTLYHAVDVTAYVMLLIRAVVADMEQNGLYAVRERVTEVVANVLATYRNTLCSTAPPSQLSLPENLSLLPVFLNSLLKNPLLEMTAMNSVARLEDVYPRGDLRSYAKWIMYNCTPERVMDYLYPHLYCLEEGDDSWGQDHGDWISMPDRLPLSGKSLTHHKIFLLSGESGLCLIVGKAMTIDLCTRVFGVSTVVNTIHAASLSVLESDDPLCIQIQNAIQNLRDSLGEYLQVRVVLRGEKEMDQVSFGLKDDRVRMDPTLSEFVCSFFKKVMEKYRLYVF